MQAVCVKFLYEFLSQSLNFKDSTRNHFIFNESTIILATKISLFFSFL